MADRPNVLDRVRRLFGRPRTPLTREQEEQLRIREQRANWTRDAVEERKRFGRF